MENNEKATLNEIFVRSLTFRKTGQFKNVKDDSSLSLKVFIVSAFVIFMFEVPFLVGIYKKYPISWALLLAFASFIFNSIFVLVLSGIASLCLLFAGRHRQFTFLVIYNVVAISIIQAMLVTCCFHFLLAVVDIFDARPLNWLIFFPKSPGVWLMCVWIVFLIVNFLMVFVNLASVRQA